MFVMKQPNTQLRHNRINKTIDFWYLFAFINENLASLYDVAKQILQVSVWYKEQNISCNNFICVVVFET